MTAFLSLVGNVLLWPVALLYEGADVALSPAHEAIRDFTWSLLSPSTSVVRAIVGDDSFLGIVLPSIGLTFGGLWVLLVLLGLVARETQARWSST